MMLRSAEKVMAAREQYTSSSVFVKVWEKMLIKVGMEKIKKVPENKGLRKRAA